LSAATCAARPAAQPWPAPNASSLPDSDVVGPERSCFDVTQVEPDPLSRLCHRTPRSIFPHVVLQPDSVRPTDKHDTSSKLLISISCSPRSASPTILSAEFSLSHPPLPTTCECIGQTLCGQNGLTFVLTRPPLPFFPRHSDRFCICHRATMSSLPKIPALIAAFTVPGNTHDTYSPMPSPY
jgi:hypothetical protein